MCIPLADVMPLSLGTTKHHTKPRAFLACDIVLACITQQEWAVQVVHVSPDLRKAYIGHPSDVTAQGKSIMAFNKSWRSLPIQSWSGGVKIAG